MKNLKPLAWRTSSSGATKTAAGRWPEWSYELHREEVGEWAAVFVTDTFIGKSFDVLKTGTFAQARAAAATHHNHSGGSI